MATLDDLFAASMKTRKLLDLSHTKIFCDEDFAKYIDRVPEMKTTPETVNDGDIKISDTDFSFTLSKKDKVEAGLPKYLSNFLFEEPMPISMRPVRLEDLALVDIHWKMLTDLRPLNRKEEDYFNRLVDLGKFQRDTRLQDAKALATALSRVSGSPVQAKAISLGFVVYKSKKGTVETRIKTCKGCGFELCMGKFCKLQHYEKYARVILDADELEAEDKGFSLKGVIDQANASKDVGAKKAAETKARSEKKKKPSLKAMLSKGGGGKKKKKKKKVAPE